MLPGFVVISPGIVLVYLLIASRITIKTRNLLVEIFKICLRQINDAGHCFSAGLTLFNGLRTGSFLFYF